MANDKETHYISSEEHARKLAEQHEQEPKKITISQHSIIVVAVVIVLCVLSFLGGEAVQRHHGGTVRSTTASFGNGQNGFRSGARRGGFGQVTAVSATSITISNPRTGTDKTYTITSSTAITDNGQSVSYTDIQVGETVMIATSGTGSTTATTITVNPAFGGPGAAPTVNGTTTQ